jgi:hypothetical protein
VPDRRAGHEDLRVLLVSCFIGIPASLAAFAFLALLHALEHGVWADLPHALGWATPPWSWPLPCLLVAGAVVGAIVRWIPGHGGHSPIDGVGLDAMPIWQLPGVLLAALAGLSLGAVHGPEAPLLALGAGVAMLLAHPSRVTRDDQLAAVVRVTGVAAAISVVFGNPLIAALLVLEVVGLAGRQLTAVLLSCLASAGIGALVFTGVGAWTGLPPRKRGGRWPIAAPPSLRHGAERGPARHAADPSRRDDKPDGLCRRQALTDTARMVLTKTFPREQFDRGLESWSWIGLEGKTPQFASLFGDVFLSSDQGWWLLDRISGTLELRWANRQQLMDALAAEDGQDEFLLGALAMAAARRGTALGKDEVYDFMPPPILGGGFAVENIFAQSFVVTLTIAGQIHQQTRGLPPGTSIGGIRSGD